VAKCVWFPHQQCTSSSGGAPLPASAYASATPSRLSRSSRHLLPIPVSGWRAYYSHEPRTASLQAGPEASTVRPSNANVINCAGTGRGNTSGTHRHSSTRLLAQPAEGLDCRPLQAFLVPLTDLRDIMLWSTKLCSPEARSMLWPRTRKRTRLRASAFAIGMPLGRRRWRCPKGVDGQ